MPSAVDQDLHGKRILVTGASSGLGSVCATALASHGMKLALAARSGDKLDELRLSLPRPGEHMTFAADLLVPQNIFRLIEKSKEFFGDFDVLLHVLGGGLGLRDPLLTWNDWGRLYNLNLVTAAEINRLVLPIMIKKGKGNIVHVGSVASQEATASVGYNTVKAALAAYVRSLGRELAHTGVIITGILPGAFWAPQNSWERLNSQEPEIVEKFINERLPRKRLAKAEELVPMILLLCSDAASMMGGCLVPIDAGEGRAYVTD